MHNQSLQHSFIGTKARAAYMINRLVDVIYLPYQISNKYPKLC